jgi:threonyl-tRNA synthetase
MSTSAHPVSSTAEPAPATEQHGPLPDVTAPHDTAAPPPAAGAPQKGKQQQKEGKEGKSKDKKDKKGGGGGSSGPLELAPPPGYFEERIKIFDEYMAKYKQHVAGESRVPGVVGVVRCVRVRRGN